MSALVNFTDMRAEGGDDSMCAKLEWHCAQLRMSEWISPGQLVALKVHVGEDGCHSFVPPLWVRAIVDHLKTLGAKPFITEAPTLYKHRRGNAVDHIETTMRNGWGPDVVGCPFVPAAGLHGADGRTVTLEKGRQLKKVEIASVIAEADALIVVTHFKVKSPPGFGGLQKNLGMGCVTQQQGRFMHAGAVMTVNPERCQLCGACLQACPNESIHEREGKAWIDLTACLGCGHCADFCPQHGITSRPYDHVDFQHRIADFTAAVIAQKRKPDGSAPMAYFNFLTQITPHCDCTTFSDAYIVPDIGVVSSLDPVATDKASADLVNDAPGNPLGPLAGTPAMAPGVDKFRQFFPDTDWRVQLETLAALGCGSMEYTLVKRKEINAGFLGERG